MIQNFIIISKTNPLISSTKLLSHNPKSPLSFSSKKMLCSNAVRAAQTVHPVPGFGSDEMERVAQQTLTRYTFEGEQQHRKGKGVAIVWFRNDLRILDNEVLFKAWVSSEAVLPVYCVDPRLFGATHFFGFPKTGGIRFSFLWPFSKLVIESLYVHWVLDFALWSWAITGYSVTISMLSGVMRALCAMYLEFWFLWLS